MTAARALHETGVSVTVFEKARGFGGRMNTRRSAQGLFDMGAQYFTARDPLFMTAVRRWCDEGVAVEWKGRIVESHGGPLLERGGEVRYRGEPGMSRICRFLGADLTVRFERRVTRIERRRDAWFLDNEGRFDAVLVSAPASQSAQLLEPVAPALAQRARTAAMVPCVALAILFEAPLSVGFQGAILRQGPLSWVWIDEDKAVLHAAPDWSQEHFDQPETETTATLLHALRALVGAGLPETVRVAQHGWRFARTVEALGVPYLWDPDLRIGACGDWCLGARIESAYLSGVEAADVVVTS